MSRIPLASILKDRGLTDGHASFEADLHLHSVASDGSDGADRIIAQAKKHGLTHVAFTNHDTTRDLNEAARAGEEGDVRIIGGIEVSAYDFARKRKVHVVGLDVREDSPALAALCADTLARRNENARWQLDRLLEAGYEVNVAKVEAYAARSTCLYKQHLMAALTEEPYESLAYRTLYRSLFKDGGICARDIDYVDARDAVAAIVEDGGLPVLAHPGQFDSWDFVSELVQCGLAGIEMMHPDHSPADEKRAFELAEEHSLFCSSGSDYHGTFGAPPHVGYRRVCG